MRRRWLVALCLAVAGVALAGWWLGSVPFWAGPMLGQYRRICIGMTPGEVRAVMGREASDPAVLVAGRPPWWTEWWHEVEADGTIEDGYDFETWEDAAPSQITVKYRGGQVVGKVMRQESAASLPDLLRDLHLSVGW
jgi:hypothetical protein